MQRYFAIQKVDNSMILEESDWHHIWKVMRMQSGDYVEVVYDSKLYICKIENVNDLSSLSVISEVKTNDDFVPQVPLADWGYSKHGITFVETAETLYSNNSLFKNDLDVYAADSNKGNVSFSLLATNTLISSVLEYWTSTQEYYEKTYNMDSNDLSSSLWTLYHFFREVIAPAAMGEVMGYINIAPFMNVSGIFNRIASFFVHGSAIRNYIYFGHHAFTYYSAIKHDLFN